MIFCVCQVDDPVCGTCGEKIVHRYLLQVNGAHYHTDCLRCVVCNVGLQTESSCFIRDARIYCKGDYYRYAPSLQPSSHSFTQGCQEQGCSEHHVMQSALRAAAYYSHTRWVSIMC